MTKSNRKLIKSILLKKLLWARCKIFGLRLGPNPIEGLRGLKDSQRPNLGLQALFSAFQSRAVNYG